MDKGCFVCGTVERPRRVRVFDVYFNTVEAPICEKCFTVETSEASVGVWADGPLA